jgi:[ribosomal protein S5]-alanine N-acetyltransferase
VTPILETDRLTLREFEPSDLDPYAAMIGDPETMRYYPRPYSRAEAESFIQGNLARYRAYGFGVWVIEEKATRSFLGDCGLAISLVEGIPEVEVMWHVVRDRWREGIATEAARAACLHGFGPVGVRRIVALVRPENEPSKRVARKLGMEVEREVLFHDLPHVLWVMGPPDGHAPPEDPRRSGP